MFLDAMRRNPLTAIAIALLIFVGIATALGANDRPAEVEMRQTIQQASPYQPSDL